MFTGQGHAHSETMGMQSILMTFDGSTYQCFGCWINGRRLWGHVGPPFRELGRKATNWNTAPTLGEPPIHLFRKIWNRMWLPNGGFGAVSVTHTYTDNAGAPQSSIGVTSLGEVLSLPSLHLPPQSLEKLR